MSRVFGDPAVNSTVRWMPEPTHRGTVSLLSTCLMTMFLCVWSALHLNVPTTTALGPRILRKTLWLLLALLAPELVAFAAFQQRREAMYTANIVRKLQGHAPLESSARKILNLMLRRSAKARCVDADQEMSAIGQGHDGTPSHPWTLVHGFYAVMGGFVIDTSQDGDPFLPHGLHKATLTSTGVRFLARRALPFLPDIPKGDIQDKSKANQLAKTVVCLQAFWFCMQCVGRLASKLPISLLELNTFGHAICTLLLYLLWWDKPLDVEQPTLIRSKEAYPIHALMALVNGDIGYPWKSVDIGRNNELKVMFREGSSAAQNSEQLTTRVSQPACPGGDIVVGDNTSHRNIQVSFSIGHDYPNKFAFAHPGPFHLILSAQHDRYWHLVSEAFALYPEPSGSSWKVEYYASCPGSVRSPGVGRIRTRWQHVKDEGRPAITHRSRNWPGGRFVADFNLTSYFSSFSAAGLFYGGLHTLAWNAPFASSTQMLLWRISSVSLTVSGPVIIVMAGSLLAGNVCFEGWSIAPSVMVILLVLFSFCFAVFYIFVRAFLIVESFLSLSHAPESVYRALSWSQYLPHIT